MINMNPALKIIIENATTCAEKNKIFSLMEAELNGVNNTMVSNLYKSAIDKAHIDFEDIPESKGDITKYSGYSSMMSTINIIKEIAIKSNIKIADLEIVEKAISNITAYRESFEKGFKLEKEFIILQYNTLVLACVEAVSALISSYVDYIKRPDRIEFTIIKNNKAAGSLCITNLGYFNETVKKGDFSKVLNAVINSGKEGFVGVDDLIVPTIIIGGVLMIVPLIREMIFFFYYSRMKVSDYLKQQAGFLELNKNNLEANNMPAKKKNEILKKQEQTIKQLYTWSDKIKVNQTLAADKSGDALRKENKAWTIDEVQSQTASTDSNGFKLL